MSASALLQEVPETANPSDPSLQLNTQAGRSEDLRNRKRITYFIWDLLLSQYGPGWVLWILMSYLTEVRQETLTHAAATVNLFNASISIFSILPTFLMNTWPGLYFTTLLSSVTYATGLSLLWSVAVSEQSNSQNKVFYTALFVCALGKAGTSVTFKPFYDRQTRYYKRAAEVYEENTLNRDMMVLYLIGLVLLLFGNVVLPFLSSWGVLFGVPSLTMIFISYKLLRGYRTIFIPDEPKRGSEKLAFKENIFLLLADDDDDEDEEEEEDEEGSAGWSMIKMIPLWITFLMPALVTSIGSTYFVEQADSMSTKVFGFIPMPVPTLLVSFTTGLKAARARYIRQREDPELDIIKKYIPVKDVGNGAFLSIVCCVIAALVELKRMSEIKKHGPGEPIPMSLIWLVSQVSFLGYVYGNSQSGIKGFFTDQLPRRMRRHAGLLTDVTFAVGTMLSVLAVYVAQTVSSNGGKSSGWFGDTINTTRLDYFYWTLAILSAINLLVLAFLATMYNYKEACLDKEEEEQDDPLVYS